MGIRYSMGAGWGRGALNLRAPYEDSGLAVDEWAYASSRAQSAAGSFGPPVARPEPECPARREVFCGKAISRCGEPYCLTSEGSYVTAGGSAYGGRTGS